MKSSKRSASRFAAVLAALLLPFAFTSCHALHHLGHALYGHGGHDHVHVHHYHGGGCRR